MSPERCLGNSKSIKNDIWSVGATFVEMITGHPLNYTDSIPHHRNKYFKITKYSLMEYLKIIIFSRLLIPISRILFNEHYVSTHNDLLRKNCFLLLKSIITTYKVLVVPNLLTLEMNISN